MFPKCLQIRHCKIIFFNFEVFAQLVKIAETRDLSGKEKKNPSNNVQCESVRKAHLILMWIWRKLHLTPSYFQVFIFKITSIWRCISVDCSNHKVGNPLQYLIRIVNGTYSQMRTNECVSRSYCGNLESC